MGKSESALKCMGRLILFCFLSVILITSIASAQKRIDTKQVLILISGHKELPGVALVEKGIRSTLEGSPDFQFEYYTEYMDRLRFNDLSYLSDLLNLYKSKYVSTKIDLVIADGYMALDFAVTFGEELFPGTPVVFCTVNEFQYKQLQLDRKYTGTLLKIDYTGLLEVALRNHPSTRNVAVLAGTSKVGRSLEEHCRKVYAPYAKEYNFMYLGDLAMTDLLEKVSTLPDHTVIIYLYIASDGDSQLFEPWQVASVISKSANAPVYGMSDSYLGKGIVGGAVFSLEAQGGKASEIGLRILKGERPTDIPSTSEGTIRDMFDWRQLKRWNINKNSLSQDSVIRYKELTVWEKYKWYIIVAALLIVSQMFTIIFLLIFRRQNLLKENLLQQSEERYRAFVENSQEGIWCVEFNEPIQIDLPEEEQFELVYTHGYISMANDVYAKSVGLERGNELVGARLENFAPRTEPTNVATIKAWINQSYSINNAETVETYVDGITRNILNSTTAIIKDGYVDRVWGTQRDITDQRQSEKALGQSKDFNRAILNSIEDQICVLDKDGVILAVNDSWLEFAGENNADLKNVGVGVNYLDQFRTFNEDQEMSSTDRESAAEAMKGITELYSGHREIFIMEYPCHSPTVQRWFQMVALPFKGKKGGLVVAHRDITKRKEMEQRLSDAQLHYRTVADYTYDWEYWEAHDGSLKYVSPSCERITGYTVSEFINNPELILEIILPEDLKIWEAHPHGEPVKYDTSSTQFRIVTKRGGIKWIAHVCQPVFSDSGEYEGVRASNRDITAYRESEKKMRSQSEQLYRLERRQNLGQMVGSIAHELNQPLTGILSDAQAGDLLLGKDNVDLGQIKSIFTDIISDTKRASLIMRNLRKLFAGDEYRDLDSFDINELILETLKLLNSEFLSKGAICYNDFSDGLPDVEGNRIQIQQVLINLLRNSLQAMELLVNEDSLVTISTTLLDEEHVAISIKDNGPGVKQDIRKEIFEPLATTKKEGMGMGLAISSSIIKAHGGELWLENNAPSGAVFTFTLPMRR